MGKACGYCIVEQVISIHLGYSCFLLMFVPYADVAMRKGVSNDWCGACGHRFCSIRTGRPPERLTRHSGLSCWCWDFRPATQTGWALRYWRYCLHIQEMDIFMQSSFAFSLGLLPPCSSDVNTNICFFIYDYIQPSKAVTTCISWWHKLILTQTKSAISTQRLSVQQPGERCWELNSSSPEAEQAQLHCWAAWKISTPAIN